MKLRSIELEKKLSQRVWDEVKESPALWKEYSPSRWLRLFLRLTQPIVVIALPFMLIFVPIMLNFLWIGLGIISDSPQFPREARAGNGPELALLLQAFSLTGSACLTDILLLNLLRSPESATFAHLPVADSDLYRSHQMGWLLCIPIGACFSIWGYGYWAWMEHLPAVGWVVGLALCLLQGLVCVAMPLALLGRRSLILPWAAAFCVAMSIVVAFHGYILKPYMAEYGWPFFLISPPGWINGIYYFGVLRGQTIWWLALLPVCGIIYIAARRVCQPFAIREFIIGQVSIEAIPANEWRPPYTLRSKTSSPTKTIEPSSPAEMEARIRQREYLAPWDLQGLGWIERIWWKTLSPRERTLAELMRTTPPRWSLHAFWGTAAFVACAAVLAIPTMPELDTYLMLPVFLLVAYLFCGRPNRWSVSSIITNGPPGASVGYRILPVSYREVMIVWLKHAAIRLLLIFPAALLYGALASWRIGHPPTRGLLVVIKVLYFLLCLDPALTGILFSQANKGPQRLQWPGFQSMCFLFVFCVFGYCGIGIVGFLFFNDTVSPWLQLLGAGIIPMFPLFLWWWNDRRWVE